VISSEWELKGVACHMGSHNATCHPTQANTLRLTQANKAGTQFSYITLMDGRLS